jgi:hypothetical protein
MSDVFVNSGENSDNVVVPSPQLSGVFIPGIDNSFAVDGFGLVTPLGGGSTVRKYSDYGISAEVSQYNTQLTDLANALTIGGGGVSYNLEGLVGPRGLPGRDGTTLIIHQWEGLNSNYLAALPHNLSLINQLGTASDKLIYTSAYTTTSNFVWEQTDIDTSVSSWNESSINTDASFFIIAADDGIYVSTDEGDNWTQYTPDSDAYEQTNCENSGGDAVVLGTDGKDRGAFLLTGDYGVNWSEVTVTV